MADSHHPRPPFFQLILAKLAASRFLTTSLVIHVALITLLGSVVLFKATQQTDGFVAVGSDGILAEQAEQASEPTDTPQEFEEPAAASAPAESAITPASSIQSLAENASFSMSGPSDQQVFGNTIGISDRAMTSVGGASTSKASTGGGKLSGTLFGVKIETNKLGVMLDVSGSAHPFLLGALEEIDKNFKGMPTVLVFGCGGKKDYKNSSFSMKDAAKSDKDYKEMEDALQDRDDAVKKAAGETVFGQVANARNNKKLKDLDRYLGRMLKRPDVYWSVNDKGFNPRFGTHIVMKFLADQDVDTIYWFSDLADAFDVEAAEDIGKKLKAKGIKVIAHDFDPSPNSTAAVKAAEKIVELTGGQLISKKLN